MNKALMIAAKKGSVDTVKDLLRQGARVNAKDKKGRTSLHWAAYNGHTDVVLTLLEAGADVLVKDSKGETPLTLAKSRKRSAAAVKLLTSVVREKVRKILSERGIQRSTYSAELRTAFEKEDCELISLLLTAGADADTEDKNSGKTLLREAAEQGKPQVVRAFLEGGADVKAALSGGWSKLHFAASAGLTDRVRKLLESGADVNAKDEVDGDTPLHEAVSNGYTDIVRLLLDAGADVNAKSNSGSPRCTWLPSGVTRTSSSCCWMPEPP